MVSMNDYLDFGQGFGTASANVSGNDRNIVNPISGSYAKIYIDFANNSMSRSDFESFLDTRFTYTVTSLDSVSSMLPSFESPKKSSKSLVLLSLELYVFDFDSSFFLSLEPHAVIPIAIATTHNRAISFFIVNSSSMNY